MKAPMAGSKSSVNRILSGSAAAWARIAVTIVSQIALVPLYLSSWDAPTFGAWLLLQAVWGVITMMDIGHQDYVGYECLRLGSDRISAIATLIASALPVALTIAVIDFLLIWILTGIVPVTDWIGIHPPLLHEWRAALLLQAASWVMVGSGIALIVKGFAPFGHYPRIAWWGTAYALVTALAPGLAVIWGAGLWGASVALFAASAACNVACALDLYRIAPSVPRSAIKPSAYTGIANWLKSLWLTANGLVGMVRQQGVRLALVPMAGVSEMAAFSTMRTGANFALQGLSTITVPVMPELMRYLVARDQHRTESTFAVVWLVLCAVLSPGVLVIQALAPVLFPIWTRGKIAFDPALFSMLSTGVLVFALAQPAAAVVAGNNLLRSQLAVSVLAAAITVGGMLLFVPAYGIRGAAMALLGAEAINLLFYVFRASAWLRGNNMRWPTHAFSAASISVANAAAGLCAMTLFPDSRTQCLAVSLALAGLVAYFYWRQLPPLARTRAVGLLARFLPGRWRTKNILTKGGRE
jgi:O-antigen/teichoic acid export membrane protein